MDVKQAVKTAIDYVIELFQGEQASNIGLEEVLFNEAEKVWEVTIGFSRPWDYKKLGLIADFQECVPMRQYKIIQIDSKTEQVKSVKIRKV